MIVDDPGLNIAYHPNGLVNEANENNNTLTKEITIKPNTVDPSITILSPNGRDIYNAGQQITVKWKTENIPTGLYNIQISLRYKYRVPGEDKDRTSSQTLLPESANSLTKNDGSETLILPSVEELKNISGYNSYGLPVFGRYYEIYIAYTPSNYVSISDSSDSLFTINDSIIDTESGCPAGKIYSSTTGQLCGCSHGEVYSSTTGQRCLANTNPVISGVSGPQTLNINQTGTWKVTASSSTGGNLSYSVIWGDEVVQTSNSTATRQVSQQTATFTHSYLWAGTFIPTFTVTNSNSRTATTSLSVKVSNTNICPVYVRDPNYCKDGIIKEKMGYDGCLSYECLPPYDGCLPGHRYSTTTGQICPVTTDDGCKSGYKYSPVTGQACVLQIKTCSSSNGETGCGNPNTLIKRTLKKGIKGDDVKILQLFLNLAADGSFGPATKAKVIEWQKSNGLKADGAFGNASRLKAGL